MTQRDFELILFGACLQHLPLLNDIDPLTIKDGGIRCLMTALKANQGKPVKDSYQVKTWLETHGLPDHKIVRGIMKRLADLKAAETASDEAWRGYWRLRFAGRLTPAATPSETSPSAASGGSTTPGANGAIAGTIPSKPLEAGSKRITSFGSDGATKPATF